MARVWIPSWIMCRIKKVGGLSGKILKEYGIDDGLVLDLGCGTGSMTEMLASSGYDMIGVDNAEEMLEIAMEKKVGVDMIFCIFFRICGNLNYMERSEQL